MAKKITEHSRAVKIAYSQKWVKEQIASGKKKSIGMVADTEIVNAFQEVVDEMGLSKAQTLKALVEFYRTHKK